MLRKLILAVPFVCFAHFPEALAQPQPDASHGELLYSTHCITCHSLQVHWRDKQRVVDWASLLAEVRRWQQSSRLGWSDADIADVAQYLNTLHYHFPTAD